MCVSACTHVWMWFTEARKSIGASVIGVWRSYEPLFLSGCWTWTQDLRGVCGGFAHESFVVSHWGGVWWFYLTKYPMNLSCLFASIKMYSCTVSTMSWKVWEMKVCQCKVFIKLIYLLHGILSPNSIGELFSEGFMSHWWALICLDVVTCEWAAGCRDRYVALRGQSWHPVTVSVPQNCGTWGNCIAVLASSQCHYLRGQHLLHKCLRRSKCPWILWAQRLTEGKCPRRGSLTRFSESTLVNWGTCWTQLTTSEFSQDELSANFPHLPIS